MAKDNKKNQILNGEDNEYLKIREMRVQENQQRLRDMGIKNIVKSMTSLAQSHQMKKKTMKQSTHVGDVDYIPDPSDHSEEDYQQVARSSVSSKKQHNRQYISPMSINRVANNSKLRRVVAPNSSQKAPSTLNATKPNKQQATVTMSEISESNKGGARKGMTLVDEDDIEDDEIFKDHNSPEDEEQSHGPEKQKAYGFDSTCSSKGRRKRLHIISAVSNEHIEGHIANDHVENQIDNDHVEDHQVFETQGHQNSEIQGASKKVRGYTQKAETWKMDSTQKIVVTFNKFGMPVGDEGNELVQFLGTLVRMPDHVSIEYADWRKVPVQNKKDMYSLVKSKFVFHPNETNQITNWILYSMGRKWRAWKGSLKARAYDPSLTVEEIVSRQVKNDNRVNAAQFKKLVTSWFTSEFQKTCDAKRLSRSKMKEPHVTGTKSFARLAHEMAMQNNGVYPRRGELYIKTHTRKDGSIVDDNAAHVVASLKDIANDSTITSDDPNDFTNDEYSKVKGPEKRGYVRLVGRTPTAKSNVSSSTASQTIDQLQSVVSAMAMIIQKHIPNANLSSVLSNMNMQVPGISSLVHNNSLSTNEISCSRIHDDNGQQKGFDN